MAAIAVRNLGRTNCRNSYGVCVRVDDCVFRYSRCVSDANVPVTEKYELYARNGCILHDRWYVILRERHHFARRGRLGRQYDGSEAGARLSACDGSPLHPNSCLDFHLPRRSPEQ